MNRRGFILTGASSAASTFVARSNLGPSAASGAPWQTRLGGSGLELGTQPQRVFKCTADANRLRLDRWLFNLAVVGPDPVKVHVEELVITHRSGGDSKAVCHYPSGAAPLLDIVATVPTSPVRPTYAVAGFQIAGAQPAALAIDNLLVEVVFRAADGGIDRLRQTVNLETFTQQTKLVFPFRGHGLITQGGAWNDGHRNRSGMFAIDALGLTESYAAMLRAGDEPAALAGWGRPILAPADGYVVVARGDRPDQPMSGVSDPKYYAPEFPSNGDPGNHCVIDHGNGEFSMLAHFRSGSLAVRVGDRVAQGQQVGELGNSGDTTSPHVHHQVQSGPNWLNADALPHRYTNGPEGRHDRGTMFNAK